MTKQARFQFSLRLLCVGVVAAGVLLGLLIYFGPLLLFYVGFRQWPREHIETLNNPIAVSGWNDTSLSLADGRSVALPGVLKLPTTLKALSAATERGIEISNGRIFGLVRVWHWCGNDSLRNHIARVDLGHLLEFVGEGECAQPMDPDHRILFDNGGRFTNYGWDIGEYGMYKSYESSLLVGTSKGE